jgi:hypothetical protein
MPFCFPYRPRLRLAALTLLALVGCSAFESQADNFPDAGPNGPDSTYAGVGQGIPFGEFALTPDQFRPPYTSAVVPVTRSSVASVLRAAQDHKLRLILNLAGGASHYTNSDGTFNFELWKAQVATYRDVDFSPYVTEGLVLAHFLIDEPGAALTWGGRPVSRAQIEEMANYSKSIWPSLPTTVRASAEWLRQGDTTYASLDIAWAQWAGPGHGGGAGLTPEEFRDKNVARAKELQLGLIFGLNLLDGGDGSSGITGTEPGWWQMSPPELTHAGTVLAGAPYACALLSWRYHAPFESRPDIREALDSVARLAATRGGTSCTRRGADSTP